MKTTPVARGLDICFAFENAACEYNHVCKRSLPVKEIIPFWKEGASSKSCPNPNPNSQSSYLFSSSSTSFRFIRTRFGVDCCCRVSSFTYK
ncbi:hypothetical protein VNO80_17004 [Phaseolus coccineus]|uniref:Uncharacterized protein n=1 Tax=Phaseolus coccineus TaxID=3886 RepID=A0AAN9R4I0_PHACN